jgi:hypothetical protein
MQLVGVANRGPRFGGDLRNSLRIERANALCHVRIECPPQLHSSGATLLERGVVEIRIGIRIQNLVGERRRLGCVDCDRANRPAIDSGDQRFKTIQIHRFVKTVGDCLGNQRMIGNADFTGEIFRTRRLIRKHRRHQIVRLHAQNRRRRFASASKAQHSQSAR